MGNEVIMLKGFKKTANPKEFTRIGQDDKGNESSRVPFNIHKHPGYAKELADFIENGGVVEEAETAEELAERENKEKEDLLKSLESKIIANLNDSEIHVSNHPHHPDDVPQWKTAREAWWLELEQVKLGNIIEVTPKPFGNN